MRCRTISTRPARRSIGSANSMVRSTLGQNTGAPGRGGASQSRLFIGPVSGLMHLCQSGRLHSSSSMAGASTPSNPVYFRPTKISFGRPCAPCWQRNDAISTSVCMRTFCRRGGPVDRRARASARPLRNPARYRPRRDCRIAWILVDIDDAAAGRFDSTRLIATPPPPANVVQEAGVVGSAAGTRSRRRAVGDAPQHDRSSLVPAMTPGQN